MAKPQHKKATSIEPNAHAAIPTDNGIARFSVPKDNPFVHTTLGGTWDGTYNGSAVAPLSGVRSEFWCTGLRHTWRFSFDSATGDLWGGDVLAIGDLSFLARVADFFICRLFCLFVTHGCISIKSKVLIVSNQ